MPDITATLSGKTTGKLGALADAILSTNPLLEAFGNAKTARQDYACMHMHTPHAARRMPHVTRMRHVHVHGRVRVRVRVLASCTPHACSPVHGKPMPVARCMVSRCVTTTRAVSAR